MSMAWHGRSHGAGTREGSVYVRTLWIHASCRISIYLSSVGGAADSGADAAMADGDVGSATAGDATGRDGRRDGRARAAADSTTAGGDAKGRQQCRWCGGQQRRRRRRSRRGPQRRRRAARAQAEAQSEYGPQSARSGGEAGGGRLRSRRRRGHGRRGRRELAAAAQHAHMHSGRRPMYEHLKRLQYYRHRRPRGASTVHHGRGESGPVSSFESRRERTRYDGTTNLSRRASYFFTQPQSGGGRASLAPT